MTPEQEARAELADQEPARIYCPDPTCPIRSLALGPASCPVCDGDLLDLEPASEDEQ